jgi:hypothetical protein
VQIISLSVDHVTVENVVGNRVCVTANEMDITREGAAGSGLRALRRLAAEPLLALVPPSTVLPVAVTKVAPPRVVLASDSVSWATTASLGTDGDGALLAALSTNGHGLNSSSDSLVGLAAMGEWEGLLAALQRGDRMALRSGVLARVGNEARTALHYAAAAARCDVVSALILAGADVRAVGARPARRTPLGAAADAQKPVDTDSTAWDEALADVVSALLRAGADVNVVEGDYGSTPLHLAARRGYFAVVSQLVQFGGADFMALDSLGDTPADVAEDAGFNDLATLLRG